MRSLIDREPAWCGPAGMIEPGDDAPEFIFTVDGSPRRLSEFRGSPVVVVFHGTYWDPARDEYVDAYNRLVSSLGGVAGARLLEIGGMGPWRDLTFTDAALSVPVVSSADSDLARRYGIGNEPAVFVIDGSGVVRWSQIGPMSLANPVEVARAISAVAAPFVGEPNEYAQQHSAWTRRDFVATTLAAAFALALRPIEARAERAAALAPRSNPTAQRVTLNVNGRDLALDVEPRVTLLDAL